MTETKVYEKGWISALASYFIWGFMPLYWKQLPNLTSLEMLAFRIFFSFVLLMIVVAVVKKRNAFSYLRGRLFKSVLTACLLGVNWGVYLYAVNVGQVVQASLGYFINPLFSIILGVLLFKEKLTKVNITAVILAAVGVAYLTVSYGSFPWISIVLAISFGLYGFFKKKFNLDSVMSLSAEIMVLVPIAIAYLIFLTAKGQNHMFTGDSKLIFIFLSGIITVVPLYLFSEGAKALPLSAVGFLQYTSPTIMLLLGVLLYGEAFTTAHMVGFAFIWSGLLLYTVSMIRKNRRVRV